MLVHWAVSWRVCSSWWLRHHFLNLISMKTYGCDYLPITNVSAKHAGSCILKGLFENGDAWNNLKRCSSQLPKAKCELFLFHFRRWEKWLFRHTCWFGNNGLARCISQEKKRIRTQEMNAAINFYWCSTWLSSLFSTHWLLCSPCGKSMRKSDFRAIT